MKKQARTKFSDPLIVPRVKNYLAENVDKTFVDVSQMARSLKERYREYSGRSENAFCEMVEAAYKVVLQSYGLDGASSSGSGSEDSDDLELLDDSNVLNDQLMAIYKIQEKKANNKKDRGGGDKTSELIDISSDEESGTGKACKLPKLNDQITISAHVPDAVPQKPKQVVPVVSINATKESAPVAVIEAHESRKKKSATELTSRPGPLKRKSVQVARTVPEPEPEHGEQSSKKATITFDDIGGMSGLLERVCDLMMHMRHPEVFRRLGVAGARGALLHGPPGCGKTLLAHAIAGRLGLPLLALPATELVGPLSGESERRIREAFDKAKALAPCVLFIDEIDAICADRQNAQKDMERRMVSQLLASLDSLSTGGEGQGSQAVLVLAACANPASLDPALRRAGRFEHELALGIPSRAARRDILRVLVRPLALHPAVDLDSVARLTPGFVGADLRALLDRACTLAIKRVFQQLKAHPHPAPDPPIPAPTPALTTDAPDVENTPRVDNNAGSQNGVLHEGTGNDKEDKTDTIEPPEVLPASEEVISLDAPADADTDSSKQTEESRTNVDNEIQITQVEPQIAICETYKKEDSSQVELEDMQKYLDESEPFTEEQLSKINVTMDDILNALKTTKPCAIREGFATVPDTRWEDVGSLADVRRELQLAVLAPVKYPEQLAALGLAAPGGVLLCGPPGCGKTLLAKAVANEAGINFISVKGPELLNMYVGESERAVRTCFQRARNSAPCVIFFDEFDSLCPRRSNGDTGGASRLVNQLLTEMDGVEGREGVFVLAATNRPDIVDPAVLRPGRLDRVLFVGMPGLRDREEILEAITRRGQRPQLASDVSLQELSASTEGFTGADLAGLVRLAATEALTDFITGNISSSPLLVSAAHFRKALLKMKPSVSAKEQQHYEKLRQKYSSVGEEKADVEMDTEEWMDTV